MIATDRVLVLGVARDTTEAMAAQIRLQLLARLKIVGITDVVLIAGSPVALVIEARRPNYRDAE